MKKRRRVRVKCEVRLNAYTIIADRVEVAVRHGLNRAHKHGAPTPEQLEQAGVDAVMNVLGEVLKFSDP